MRLISTSNIASEESYTTGTETAMATSAGANVSEELFEIFNMVPDMSISVVGMGPLRATSISIDVKVAKVSTPATRILNSLRYSFSSARLSLTEAR